MSVNNCEQMHRGENRRATVFVGDFCPAPINQQDVSMILSLATTLSHISLPLPKHPSKHTTKNITELITSPISTTKTNVQQLIREFSSPPHQLDHPTSTPHTKLKSSFAAEAKQDQNSPRIYFASQANKHVDSGMHKVGRKFLNNRLKQGYSAQEEQLFSDRVSIEQHTKDKKTKQGSCISQPNGLKQSAITFSPLRIDISLPSLCSEDLDGFREQKQIISEIQNDIKVLINKIHASHGIDEPIKQINSSGCLLPKAPRRVK